MGGWIQPFALRAQGHLAALCLLKGFVLCCAVLQDDEDREKERERERERAAAAAVKAQLIAQGNSK